MLFSRVDCVASTKIHWGILRLGVSRWTKSSVVKVRLASLFWILPIHSKEPLTGLLLVPAAGQIAFREFLKSEYSEENILFWLACEEYKKIKTVPEMISSANRIFSEYVQTEAPKQV